MSLPVATPPPVFLNFGIPPAKIPPSCGAEAMAAPPVSPPSLLLLARLPPGGGGGAKPPGADGLFAIPGTGGAPIAGAAGADIFVSIIGADLSLTTTFFNLAPPSILLSSAPYEFLQLALQTSRCLNSYSVLRGVPSYPSGACLFLAWQSTRRGHRRWWWSSSSSTHTGHWRGRWWRRHCEGRLYGGVRNGCAFV